MKSRRILIIILVLLFILFAGAGIFLLTSKNIPLHILKVEKYAETHTKEIVSGSLGKIDLNTILLGYSNNFRDKKTVNSYGLFIYNYLTAYVKERKNYFKEQFQKGEIDGSDDLKKDSSYSFDFNGIDSLISN